MRQVDPPFELPVKGLDHPICRGVLSAPTNMTSTDDVRQLGEETALELSPTISCHNKRTTKTGNAHAGKSLGHCFSRYIEDICFVDLGNAEEDPRSRRVRGRIVDLVREFAAMAS